MVSVGVCHTCLVKGQLWRMENKALEQFAGGGCNVDMSAACIFDGQHGRDERPLVYNLRIMQGANSKKLPKGSVWAGTKLQTTGVVTGLPRPKTKDLAIIEDVNPEAAPVDVEEQTHASQVCHAHPFFNNTKQIF